MTPESSQEIKVELSLLQRTQFITFSCPQKTRRGWSNEHCCTFGSGRDQMYMLQSSDPEMTSSSSIPAKQLTSYMVQLTIIWSFQKSLASLERLLPRGKIVDNRLRIIFRAEKTGAWTIESATPSLVSTRARNRVKTTEIHKYRLNMKMMKYKIASCLLNDWTNLLIFRISYRIVP